MYMRFVVMVVVLGALVRAFADDVVVRFEAKGGECSDSIRVVRAGEPYGKNVNMYRSEDPSGLRLGGVKLDPAKGVFSVDMLESVETMRYPSYFMTNTLTDVKSGEKWTYVVDVVEWEGVYEKWYLGHSAGAAKTTFAQFAQGTFDGQLKSGEVRFVTLVGSEYETCNMMDRAFIHLKPGQGVKGKFRVSLFAGTGVNASNYKYVAPGETIDTPLPTPKRPGYRFGGWYDGDRLIERDSRVEKSEAHTLVAQWLPLARSSRFFTYAKAQENAQGGVDVSFTITQFADNGTLKLYWKTDDEVRELAAEGDCAHLRVKHATMKYFSCPPNDNALDEGELVVAIDDADPASYGEAIVIPVERYKPSLWQRIFGG